MKTWTFMIAISVIAFLCMISSAKSESELPAGYKAIVFGEKDPVEWRQEDKSMYLRVEADFNGDEVIDEARILRSEDDARIVLFCFLQDKAGNIITFRLKEFDDPKVVNRLGIQEEKAGSYLTAAGKGDGPDELNKDKPKSIELKHPAINLFCVESSSQFFYWDESVKDFKNVWISD